MAGATTKQRAKRLNDLSGKEWMKFSKSWFTLPPGKPDKAKQALHPATFPDTLAEQYITFFTQPSQAVLDPFLGSGTTIEAAERLDRKAVGIELEPSFADFARTRTGSPILVGDALTVLQDHDRLPNHSIDYILTSPPYWNTLAQSRGGNKDTRHKKRKERGDALTYGDHPADLGNLDDAEEYIAKLVDILAHAHRVLRPKGYLTVIIQNLNYQGSLVPIAWQLGMALANTGLYDLKGERIWCKEQGRLGIYGYPTAYQTNNFHHYCLTFRRKGDQDQQQRRTEVAPSPQG